MSRNSLSDADIRALLLEVYDTSSDEDDQDDDYMPSEDEEADHQKTPLFLSNLKVP